MKHLAWIWTAGVLAGIAACSENEGTTGPAVKTLEFSLAALVNYPLTATLEEANADQPYALVATVLLQKPEDTIARFTEDAARDPLYRVTVCEAGQAAKLCVEKTAQVDVLDFP